MTKLYLKLFQAVPHPFNGQYYNGILIKLNSNLNCKLIYHVRHSDLHQIFNKKKEFKYSIIQILPLNNELTKKISNVKFHRHLIEK